MNIDILVTTIEKRRKRKRESINFQEIGTTIRKRREEMNATQEYICNGICSISYLSKIENNKIIPNKESLAFIMEKMDLSYEGITVMYDQDRIISKVIEYYFSKKVDDYLELIRDINQFKNTLLYQVIILGYNLLIENYNDCEKIISDNISSATNMANLVFELFYLFTATYLLHKKEYNQALSLLDLVFNLAISEKKLFFLILECKFNYYAETLKTIKASMYYNDLKNYYVEANNLQRLADIQLKMMILSFETGEYQEVIEMGQRCDANYFKDMLKIYFYIGCSYFYINDYINSLKYLNNVSNSSIYYPLTLIFKCLIAKEMCDDYTLIFNELTNLEVKDNIFKAFVELFIKSEKNDITRYFLIEKTLSVVEKEGTPFEIATIRSEISKHLASNSRYKEAMCYAQLKK